MKRDTRYRIIIEDESRLQTLFSHRINRLWAWLLPLICLSVMILLGTAIMMFTPLHRILPGYLKESQRTQSQQSVLKIDSIAMTMEQNQQWINNILEVTNTDRMPGDSISYAGKLGGYDPDSLPDARPLEKRFVSAMEERERFNISVLAPLDADGMLFSPVAPNMIYASESRQSTTPVILLSSDSPIQAIADGIVLASYADNRGYTLVLQHSRGFASAYYHLGTPLVSTGDVVNAGQNIAFAPNPDARHSRWISLRIWHNGTPTPPASLLGPE